MKSSNRDRSKFRVSRRQLLAGVAACTLPVWKSWPAAAEPGFTLSEIAPGVFVHQGVHETFSPTNAGDIANCSFIVGNDAVAVIDTGGSARIGMALKKTIANVTAKPVRYVINTHMHPDHVFGNAAFKSSKGGISFVAHKKMPRALALRADRYLEANRRLLGEAAFAGVEIVMPTQLVKDASKIDLGGRTLVLTAQPTAHTDNDLIIRDTKTGTLFLGDLLFSGHVPTLDGSITGWIAQLKELTASTTAARVVPGHGPAAMKYPDALQPIRHYLEAIARDVRRMIADGATMQDAVAAAATGEKTKWQLFDDYHRRNVTAAFAELEWE